MKEELMKIVKSSYSIEGSVKWEELQAHTKRYDFSYLSKIQWSQIQCLYILGDDQNEKIKDGKVEPGCWLDDEETWLLIIGPETEKIQQYVFECTEHLTHLTVRCTSVPVLSVGHLVNVRELDVSPNDRLRQIEGLEGLHQLEKLDVSGTRFGPMLDLNGLDKLTFLDICEDAITEIRLNHELPQLESCVIGGSGMTDIGFLGYCPAMKRLSIYGGCFSDLDAVEAMTELVGLSLTMVSLNKFPKLERLKKLEELLLFHNAMFLPNEVVFPVGLKAILISGQPMTKLPDSIQHIKNLQYLLLDDLKLEELPVWLPDLGIPFGRNGIEIRNVEVPGVDMSIFNESDEVIRQWFADRRKEDGADLNEAKVIFLGDGEAGKTHTITRLLDDGKPIDFHEGATPGIVIRDKEYDIGDRRVQVHYWDFGGQEILHSMHRIFLTGRTLYVVLVNARDNTQNDRARYWLHNIRSFANGAPVLMVLNKTDQNPNASLNESDLKAMYPGLVGVVRLSALNDSEEDFNRKLTQRLQEEVGKIDTIRTFFPRKWKIVKERLESLEKPYIFGDEYQQMCAEAEIKKEIHGDLLNLFKTLGVSFYYDGEALEEYLVLRPDWITNAVYTILFNKQEEVKNGIVPHRTIHQLLKPKDGDGIKRVDHQMCYRSHEVEYVLKVLRNFRLSYLLRDGDDGEEFIPMLCDSNSLPVAAEYAADPETLEFRMEYEYLPNNVLHRLMVEMRADLNMEQVWLTGAKFEQKSTGYSAVVKSEGDVVRIFVRSENPMHRANTYLSIIKENLDRIHETMGIRPERNVVVYKDGDKRKEFEYEELLDMLENGETQVYSSAHKKRISIRDILNQTGWGEGKDQAELLRNIGKACQMLQGNRMYWDCFEDDRNTFLRDILRGKYLVNDQSFQGRSKDRAGELDLDIRRESDAPWTVLEALNLEYPQLRQDGDLRAKPVDYWNKHLDKLLENYNPCGLRFMFLVSYTECKRDEFSKVVSKFERHIRTYHSGAYRVQGWEASDMGFGQTEMPHYLRCIKAVYDRAGSPTTVYHIFVQLGGE